MGPVLAKPATARRSSTPGNRARPSSTDRASPEDVPLAVEKRGGSSYQFHATSRSVPDGCPRIESSRALSNVGMAWL
jgi:hypothetical protein